MIKTTITVTVVDGACGGTLHLPLVLSTEERLPPNGSSILSMRWCRPCANPCFLATHHPYEEKQTRANPCCQATRHPYEENRQEATKRAHK